MQESSATPSLYISVFGGCRRLLHALSPPCSDFSFWYLHPTSIFMIFTYIITEGTTNPLSSTPQSLFQTHNNHYFNHLCNNTQLSQKIVSSQELCQRVGLCRDGTDMPRPSYVGKACTHPEVCAEEGGPRNEATLSPLRI